MPPDKLIKQFELFQQTGDFLALTLANATTLQMALNFVIENKSLNIKTRASILATGVILFEPLTKPAEKDIVLSSGIHGDETAPIEICAELIKQVVLSELTLTERVLFIFGNPPAINKAQRFVELNLNTLFSGAHSLNDNNAEGACYERKRASQLEQIIAHFYHDKNNNVDGRVNTRKRLHYDLHTAIRGSVHEKFAIAPFRRATKKSVEPEQLQFLADCGVSALLLSMTPTSAFSFYCLDQFSANAFTIELGKVKLFGHNNPSDFVKVTQTLERLITGKLAHADTVQSIMQHTNLKNQHESPVKIFKVNQVINRYHDDFSLHFDDAIKNFTGFNKGDLLASDGKQLHYAEVEGEAVVFPNANVAVGQRALLTVIPEVN